MLQIKDIVKQYKDVTAVNGISFNVEPGKIFGLMGPNGAGKTTTIRMIMNIIEPSSGSILYNGEPVAGNIKNIVGYLPEERGLYKKSKVSEVIAYMGALKGADKRIIEKRTDEWLNKLEITGYKNKKIEELSKGNQQKIQFICSVIHDPEILVFDEPFSGFDPINQQNVKDIIMDFVKQGKIIILSTHQMDLAEKLCESIFLINKGKEVCHGNIEEVKRKYGNEIIKIEFSGDSQIFSNDANIKTADIYNNTAEIELVLGVKPQDYLKMIIDKVSVKSFSVLSPSLNKIFIDAIKGVDL